MNPDVVRPGTSDALFARTIDATIYPPLVRAQETATALVPRLAHAAAPLASPVLLGALALTLVFTWVAIRMRYRPSALVLGVLLVMALTSFNPAQKTEEPQIGEVSTPRTRIGGARHHDRMYTPSPQIEAPDVVEPVEPVQVYLPPDFAERLPDWSRDAMQSAERMVRDNERMREIMREIRYRVREEARRQRWREMTAREMLARR
jgi:hypothetical protein